MAQPTYVMAQPTYVAMGDSLTTGEGDLDTNGRQIGWARRLVALLGRQAGVQYSFANVAEKGATVENLVPGQIQRAVAFQPVLASVTVGANDIRGRKGPFDPGEFSRLLSEVYRRMTETGATTFTMTLPDIAHLLDLPAEFKTFAREQMACVNDIIRRLAARYDVLYFDTWRNPEAVAEIGHPRFWSDDHTHPSSYGHRRIAEAYADMLISSNRLPVSKG